MLTRHLPARHPPPHLSTRHHRRGQQIPQIHRLRRTPRPHPRPPGLRTRRTPRILRTRHGRLRPLTRVTDPLSSYIQIVMRTGFQPVLITVRSALFEKAEMYARGRGRIAVASHSLDIERLAVDLSPETGKQVKAALKVVGMKGD